MKRHAKKTKTREGRSQTASRVPPELIRAAVVKHGGNRGAARVAGVSEGLIRRAVKDGKLNAHALAKLGIDTGEDAERAEAAAFIREHDRVALQSARKLLADRRARAALWAKPMHKDKDKDKQKQKQQEEPDDDRNDGDEFEADQASLSPGDRLREEFLNDDGDDGDDGDESTEAKRVRSEELLKYQGMTREQEAAARAAERAESDREWERMIAARRAQGEVIDDNGNPIRIDDNWNPIPIDYDYDNDDDDCEATPVVVEKILVMVGDGD
ncbi:MAG: hypothetical protein WCJ30_24180 [Deltaproteobacteria bacterium]